jgi:hypothetical protein
VAANNEVGGRNLNTTGTSACAAGQEICVSFNDGDSAFVTDPHVTVRVQRTDLPTFFARIWGSKQITVAASATAEGYNPSGADALDLESPPPVAPTCVKPWLLPNTDPTGTKPIFDPQTGAMNPDLPDLLGKSWNLQCQDCLGDTLSEPVAGQYYPGAIEADDFPAPTKALPTCSAGFNSYQLAVAGCVRRPIRCGATATIDINVTAYPAAPGRDLDTFQAAKCLIHYNGAGDSDSVDSAALPSPPFQFRAGKQNPVANAVGKDVLVSDSLVTIPVINTTADQTPNTTVGVIGFLQVFVNPTGDLMPGPSIPVKIINLAGCGTNASGQPILGNGASPVAVRLISPP